MCFYIHEKHKKCKVAEDDIVCYKHLEYSFCDNLVSPYQGLLYFKKGETHPKTFKVDPIRPDGRYIFAGLHTYSNFTESKNHTYSSIHKAIIPKGTRYYYNPQHHEYVSEKLIVYNKNISDSK